MADHFYLSLWLKQHDDETMFDRFRVLLESFPYSRMKPLVRGLRVYPLDWGEQPALEENFPEGVVPETVVALASQVTHADYAYEVSAYWDLWTFVKNGGPAGWKLAPHAVRAVCYGTEFEEGRTDRGDLEIDFGLDTPFRADQQAPDAEARTLARDYRERLQENIRMLLDFIRDVTGKLPTEKKLLWCESGENFAEMIKQSFR